MSASRMAPAVEAALAPYRRTYAERPLPHVEVPAAVSEGLAAGIREGLSSMRFDLFELAPRGRYEVCSAPMEDSLCASLVGVASFLADRPFEVLRASWIRTKHGSYALLRDDSPPAGAAAD